jgi:hypothetical protein
VAGSIFSFPTIPRKILPCEKKILSVTRGIGSRHLQFFVDHTTTAFWRE